MSDDKPIDLNKLVVDSKYQRPIDEERVRLLAEEWDPEKWEKLPRAPKLPHERWGFRWRNALRIRLRLWFRR